MSLNTSYVLMNVYRRSNNDRHWSYINKYIISRHVLRFEICFSISLWSKFDDHWNSTSKSGWNMEEMMLFKTNWWDNDRKKKKNINDKRETTKSSRWGILCFLVFNTQTTDDIRTWKERIDIPNCIHINAKYIDQIKYNTDWEWFTFR